MKIVNRIVTFIMALGVFPIFIFQTLLRAVVSIADDSTLYAVLSKLMKDTVDNKMEITMSVKEAIGYIRDGQFSVGGMSFDISKIPSEMLITKNWLIASGVLLSVALLIALVIMGCALFAKAHKTVMCLSVGGMACVFASMKCFSVFAAPFINGTIDLGSILAKTLVGDSKNLIVSIGASFMDGAIKVDILQLGNVAIIIALVFLAIALWTLAYYVTIPEKEKKIKLK